MSYTVIVYNKLLTSKYINIITIIDIKNILFLFQKSLKKEYYYIFDSTRYTCRLSHSFHFILTTWNRSID